MSNLPILSNTVPANTKSAAPAKNAPNVTDEVSPIAQPFGDVLARQISGAKKLIAINQTDTIPAETLIENGCADPSKASNPSDPAAALPNDMLAALMPQPALALVVSQVTPTAPTVLGESESQNGTGASLSAAPQSGFGTGEITTEPSFASRQATPTSTEADFATAQEQAADKNAGKALSANILNDPVSVKTLQQPALPTASALQSLTNLSPVVTQGMPFVINTPLNQARWTDEFSQKITWLATANQEQHAELHLNPPQLGPLDVVLKVSGDQASAMFTSSHAAVREAIEQSIPKLRELLADNGIMLGSATVSDQAPRDQRSDSGYPRQSTASGRLPEVTKTESTSPGLAPVRRHIGVVDTFA